MLDQLVESKDNARENRRKAGILGLILAVVIAAVAVGVLWDLTKLFYAYFSQGLGGELELTALVAPVPVQAEEPPKPEPEKPTKQEQNVDTRKEIIQNIMESPQAIPDKPSVEKLKIPPRRLNMETVVGAENTQGTRPRQEGELLVTQSQGIGGEVDNTQPASDDEPTLVAAATPKPVPKTVSGGVVNSKATSLVKPAYPAAARAVRAAGQVSVQVTISESGSVISASASGGHPLLRGAAEAAARASRFSPTTLSGQPVKVTGVIIYNFVAP